MTEIELGLNKIITVKTIVHEVPNRNPYGSGSVLVAEDLVTTRLPRATRTLTHLERYILKESGRRRVTDLVITGRAHIGKR